MSILPTFVDLINSMNPMSITIVPRPSDDEIAGRNAVKYGDIWIVPEAREHLAKLIEPSMTCFEWGAGGSTIWFARHCSFTISIESHPRWYIWAMERLRKEGLDNKVQLWLAQCTKDSLDLYTDTIEAYNEQYDIVAPDGYILARRKCVELGINHLKPGGILVADNSNLYEHKDLLPGWEAFTYQTVPFEFLGNTTVWETTLYIKPK